MKSMGFMLSSIGQKFLLATSGTIMFLLFLVPHMGGNVLFLFGPDIFNSYAHHLHQLGPVVIQKLGSIPEDEAVGILDKIAAKGERNTSQGAKNLGTTSLIDLVREHRTGTSL